MPHLASPTLTAAEQKAILRATAANIRDHAIFSVALGPGLRLAELVGLNVGDGVYPRLKPGTSCTNPHDSVLTVWC